MSEKNRCKILIETCDCMRAHSRYSCKSSQEGGPHFFAVRIASTRSISSTDIPRSTMLRFRSF